MNFVFQFHLIGNNYIQIRGSEVQRRKYGVSHQVDLSLHLCFALVRRVILGKVIYDLFQVICVSFFIKIYLGDNG